MVEIGQACEKCHSPALLGMQKWEESEDLLHELTEQMDTEDGVIWVYGVEEHAVLALSEDGIECLRDLLGEHKRDHQ